MFHTRLKGLLGVANDLNFVLYVPEEAHDGCNVAQIISHFSGLCSENPHVANIAQSSQNCMSRYIDEFSKYSKFHSDLCMFKL